MRALMFVCLLVACAPAPIVEQRKLGYTLCVAGEPEEWIRRDVLGGPLEASVLAHEDMHGEQVRRFDSCRDFHVWFVVHMPQAEAEAFCAGARAEAATLNAPLAPILLRYSFWFAYGYPELELTPGQALMLIDEHCGVKV